MREVTVRPASARGSSSGTSHPSTALDIAKRRESQPSATSFMMSLWSVELETGGRAVAGSRFAARPFGAAAFHIDRLAEEGSSLRMPHSRALGDGLFELRFDLDGNACRVTFFFPGIAAGSC